MHLPLNSHKKVVHPPEILFSIWFCCDDVLIIVFLTLVKIFFLFYFDSLTEIDPSDMEIALIFIHIQFCIMGNRRAEWSDKNVLFGVRWHQITTLTCEQVKQWHEKNMPFQPSLFYIDTSEVNIMWHSSSYGRHHRITSLTIIHDDCIVPPL